MPGMKMAFDRLGYQESIRDAYGIPRKSGEPPGIVDGSGRESSGVIDQVLTMHSGKDPLLTIPALL